MKSGIEYRDLRNRAATLFKKGFDQRDAVKFQTIVQRRKNGHLFYRGLYFGGDHRWTGVETAAIHDAVADDIDFGRRFEDARFSGSQFVEQLGSCGGTLASLYIFF